MKVTERGCGLWVWSSCRRHSRMSCIGSRADVSSPNGRRTRGVCCGRWGEGVWPWEVEWVWCKWRCKF